MPKVSQNKTSFNAGELSPRLDGRVDLAKYPQGCKTLENFIPLVQGSLTRRPGTAFVHEVKTSANRTWLAKFEFNYQQSFILEFGVNYIRFYLNRAIVESSPGVPLEVTTTYGASELTTVDGTFGLSMVQSGDVIYICHRNVPPQKLSRISNTNWTLASVNFLPPPFEKVNPDSTIVVEWDVASTPDRIAASAALFNTGDNLTKFYVEQSSVDINKPWVANTVVAANQYRRNDGKNYLTPTGGTTGYVAPIHTRGSKEDGDPGVVWNYADDTTTYFLLNTYVDSTHFISDPIKTVPIDLYTTGAGSNRWAKAVWRGDTGYPTHVTFFRERLVFARDQKLWFSCAGDYENFASNEFGQILADSAISIEIQSDNSSQIVALTPTAQGLLVNTGDSEVIVSEASISEPFAPTNVKISPQGGYGSRLIKPVRVDNNVLFVQRGGKKLRESNYDFSTDSFIANDVTILSDHITKGGIIDMVYHREPYSIIWCVRLDGTLLGFTYNKLQDVTGWHRHIIGGTFSSGNAVVEAIQSIPSYDGTTDDLWMIVKRTINGVTKRYVEYMVPAYAEGDTQDSCRYMDCSATYDSTATTTVSGLTWLIGQTVRVLADGAHHPDVVVIGSGVITLNYAASVVQIGLRQIPLMRTMRLDGGSQNGTAQGKLKKINVVVVRLLNSLGVKGGSGIGNNPWQIFDFRLPSTPMDTPNPLFTGDHLFNYDNGIDTDAIINISSDFDYPITLLSIMPDVDVRDR